MTSLFLLSIYSTQLNLIAGWVRQVLWCSYFHSARNCWDWEWKGWHQKQCTKGMSLVFGSCLFFSIHIYLKFQFS